MKRLFNLFSLDAFDNYRDANRRKKVHGVVLIYRLISRQPPFCVFADAFNLFFIIRTLLPNLRFLTLLWLDGKLGSSTGFTLSCHKSGNGQEKRSFKVREKSRNLIEVRGNLCFSETLGRIYFFYQFRYLSRFFIDMKCKQIGFPKTKL